MSATVTREVILEALRTVGEPATQRDVVSLGFVKNVAVCDGVVRVSYELPPALGSGGSLEELRRATVETVSGLAGVRSVTVELATTAGGPDGGATPEIRHVIAVGAGKGGVGKSTVAALLAAGLARRGLQVGILDADVYGPSIPKITGTEDAEPYGDPDGRIVPPERHGLRIMSMGYMVPPDQAIVWRGPMAQKYVKEFLDRGRWGQLDYLIVDLPPGTGDIPLTLAQSIPLTGAVVVCTPQDVALLDAVKALRMYQKLSVDILGIVENMSYYVCPNCGHRDEIFSHGGAEQAAGKLDVPFLGGIPLNVGIRQNGDAGRLIENFTRSEPQVRAALDQLVARVIEEVQRLVARRAPAPTLRIRD